MLTKALLLNQKPRECSMRAKDKNFPCPGVNPEVPLVLHSSLCHSVSIHLSLREAGLEQGVDKRRLLPLSFSLPRHRQQHGLHL